MIHPRAVAALGALCLALVHLGANHWLAALATALLGPVWVWSSALAKRPDQQWLYHAETLAQCVLVVGLGALLHRLQANLIPYAVGLAVTHFSMMFMSTDNDPVSARASRVFACAMMADACVPIVLLALGVALTDGFVVGLWVVSIVLWRWAMWHTMDLAPLSTGQHRQYWARLSVRHGMREFWKVLRNYVDEYPSDSTPERMAWAIGHVPLQELLDYLRYYWTNGYPVGSIPDGELLLDEAIKIRICQLDSRAECIFSLMGDRSPQALKTIQELAAPGQSPPLDMLPLPDF